MLAASVDGGPVFRDRIIPDPIERMQANVIRQIVRIQMEQDGF